MKTEIDTASNRMIYGVHML